MPPVSPACRKSIVRGGSEGKETGARNACARRHELLQTQARGIGEVQQEAQPLRGRLAPAVGPLQAVGDDPDELARIYARVLNQALEGKPADLTVGLHVCRGNFRSTWISEGGYEPVAEVLFGGVNVDAFFLVYDNDRSGDFAPLRFIRPGHQQVVLGLITTKNGELENPEGIKARLEEAAKYVAKEQICLSPQCGFASTEEGNSLSESQQWDKVRLVTQIASEVW